MVAALKTFREAYQAFNDADEKYGAYVREMPEVPSKEQITEAEKLNGEVKEYEAQVLQYQQGEDLRKQYEDRKTARNTAVDPIGHGGGKGPGKDKGPQTPGDAIFDPEMKRYMDSIAPLDNQGQRYIASKTSINTPRVPINIQQKAIITGLSDTSAGAVVRPQYLNTVDLPLRELSIRDLITVIPVSTDSVSWAQIASWTNAAAPVAEATSSTGDSGVKPESSIVFATDTVAIKTIAHMFTVTNRALSDASMIRGLINQFGFYGLEEEEEDQIVSGNGVGENLMGIANVSGKSTQAWDTSLLKTTRKAILTARLARARVNGWLLSLSDHADLDLLADNEARYYYGGPTQIGAPRLWGYPVVSSEGVPDGYGYTGDLRTVVLLDREQASMQMTNSHLDYFARNLVAMLFEKRVGLAYLRPAAIVKVDLTA